MERGERTKNRPLGRSGREDKNARPFQKVNRNWQARVLRDVVISSVPCAPLSGLV